MASGPTGVHLRKEALSGVIRLLKSTIVLSRCSPILSRHQYENTKRMRSTRTTLSHRGFFFLPVSRAADPKRQSCQAIRKYGPPRQQGGMARVRKRVQRTRARRATRGSLLTGGEAWRPSLCNSRELDTFIRQEAPTGIGILVYIYI